MRTVNQDGLNVKKTHNILAVSLCIGQRRKGNKAEAATENVRTFTGGI